MVKNVTQTKNEIKVHVDANVKSQYHNMFVTKSFKWSPWICHCEGDSNMKYVGDNLIRARKN